MLPFQRQALSVAKLRCGIEGPKDHFLLRQPAIWAIPQDPALRTIRVFLKTQMQAFKPSGRSGLDLNRIDFIVVNSKEIHLGIGTSGRT